MHSAFSSTVGVMLSAWNLEKHQLWTTGSHPHSTNPRTLSETLCWIKTHFSAQGLPLMAIKLTPLMYVKQNNTCCWWECEQMDVLSYADLAKLLGWQLGIVEQVFKMHLPSEMVTWELIPGKSSRWTSHVVCTKMLLKGKPRCRVAGPGGKLCIYRA